MHEKDVVEDFTLEDQDGQGGFAARFCGEAGGAFFYPRADTPGCTIEACGFRDSFEKLQAAGAVVLGISRDTAKAQKKFQQKYALPYPLLADPDEGICDRFGVMQSKNMYGKLVKGVERTTFVIAPADAEGKQRLLHIYRKVKPEGHADEVLALIDQARTELMVGARGRAAAVAAGVGLAAGGLAYAALYPRSQIFGSVLVAPRRPREVALTFDDGPNPAATPHLLDLLARHGVRATFFVIGEFVRREPALTRAIAAAGHIVGSHTMTHPWLAWQSDGRIRYEARGVSGGDRGCAGGACDAVSAAAWGATTICAAYGARAGDANGAVDDDREGLGGRRGGDDCRAGAAGRRSAAAAWVGVERCAA